MMMQDGAIEVTVDNVKWCYPRVKPIHKGWLMTFLALNLVGILILSSLFGGIIASFMLFPSTTETISISSTEESSTYHPEESELSESLNQAFDTENEFLQSHEELVNMVNYFAHYLQDIDPKILILGSLGFVIAMFVCFLPRAILYYVLLFKGWKSLKPLEMMAPQYAEKLIHPGLAVGLLFVPVFNLFWIFVVLLKLEQLGKVQFGIMGRAYAGPSRTLLWTYCIFTVVPSIFSLFGQFYHFFSVSLMEYFTFSLICSTVLMFIEWFLACFLMTGINRMVYELNRAD